MKKKKNFLDLVPILKSNISLNRSNLEKPILEIERTGAISKVFIYLFALPNKLTMELDPLGARVVELCDNQRNVGKIAKIISKEFGKDADPLYPRLVAFLKILRQQSYIKLTEVKK